MFGYIRFAVKLGNKYFPVGALVLTHLGPDAMRIDNSIMEAFGAELDRAVSTDSNITISPTYTRQPIRS